MMLRQDREPSTRGATFAEVFINGEHECLTLEDEVREVPGLSVAKWKVDKKTAIPSGEYDVTMEKSARFGPDTITILGVPGFSSIRMHGGTTVEDTEGCPLVGDKVDRKAMTISGAKFDHVLERLKEKIKEALDSGEPVRIQIRNAPVWYAAHGVEMPEAFA